jgi:hypothetical protein
MSKRSWMILCFGYVETLGVVMLKVSVEVASCGDVAGFLCPGSFKGACKGPALITILSKVRRTPTAKHNFVICVNIGTHKIRQS